MKIKIFLSIYLVLCANLQFSNVNLKADVIENWECYNTCIEVSSINEAVSSFGNDCFMIVNYEFKELNCDNETNYLYKITSIVVTGNCTQSEVMKGAMKGIIADAVGRGINPATAAIPKCIGISSQGNSTIWEPCNVSCCRFQFFAHWDSNNYDVYLDSLKKSQYICNCSLPCYENCSFDNMPSLGRLYWSEFLSHPCFENCSIDSLPYKNTHFLSSNGTAYLDAVYQTGNCGNEPSFSYNYFDIRDDINITIEDAFKELTRHILKTIYDTQGNPNYITLKISKCWSQPYSWYRLYLPCYDVNCCTIRFQISGGGTQAQVISTNNGLLSSCPQPPPINTCSFDLCSIYQLNEYYNLPKIGFNEDEYSIDNNISINPNPNNGLFKIEFNSANTGNHQLVITDINANEVYSSNISTLQGFNVVDINLSKISQGSYFLQVSYNGKVQSKIKFIKN